MKNRLGDKARLEHILDAINEVSGYTEDISFESFQENSMMQFATVKQLEIIGEAANHLTTSLKDLHSEIDWREIVSLRNLLVHEYFGIDLKIVWDIVNFDLPKIKIQIAGIVNNL
ncbi:MAG: DUF86 domain-containing protein [Ignavibacteriae bacterium]|nr:DUF86 domain-containing protein [Ignavibacteriota bacterium]NOG99901.1 DUF86 domain-containing protein [Ignavibacteriota bacterium]